MLIFLADADRFGFEYSPMPGLNWLLIAGLALCFGTWIGISIAAWRLFHG